ncbi:MAG: NUDIX domain-containing protein [Oscillospiraceae bacterium]|nr:NUDIX domain-containing protein [Oscillospiraceae bacterium]
MELIDIYDGSRRKTGRTAERSSPLSPGERCLVAHLCLFDSRGELLIQRRSAEKKRYPGCWDLSAGGFVRSGEDSLQAVLRETREELGLKLRAQELSFILTEPFSYVLDDFYFARLDLEPAALSLQREELSAAEFCPAETLFRRLAEGSFVDYSATLMESILAFERARR